MLGTVVYLISYLFTANLLLPKLNWWQTAIVLPLLLFGLWIGWLIVLYINSLIAKGCQSVGLCADLPRRRVQSVLMGILTTIFAAQLLTAGPWLRVIGALWIVAVALNLAAALLLALFMTENPRYHWLRISILAFAVITPIWTILFLQVDWVIALVPLFISHLLILYPTLVPHSQWWGPVLRSFETSGKEVWITIDDGPTPEHTERFWTCSIVIMRAPLFS